MNSSFHKHSTGKHVSRYSRSFQGLQGTASLRHRLIVPALLAILLLAAGVGSAFAANGTSPLEQLNSQNAENSNYEGALSGGLQLSNAQINRGGRSKAMTHLLAM